MSKLLILLLLAVLISACGPSAVFVAQGPAGATGATGAAGINGTNGIGCLVQNIAIGDPVLPNGGAIVTCATGSVLISNGANGHDGKDGTNGTNGLNAPTTYSVVEIINPCNNTSAFHEVFLRFGNGTVIASFSDDANGSFTRLSTLPDGYNLQTTDHTGCVFDLTTLNGMRTIQYHGGSSESWQVSQ